MTTPKGNTKSVKQEGREKNGRFSDNNTIGTGAVSLYKAEYNEQAYKLCLLGATDKDLADFFDVSEATINNWKKDFYGFFESIKKGKKIADMEVANSLYKTTQDRPIIEQVPFKTKNVYWNAEGKRVEEEKIEIIEVEKIIPADFRSQQFWLKNRRAENWRDKQEIDHTTQGDKINIINLGQGIKPKEDE